MDSIGLQDQRIASYYVQNPECIDRQCSQLTARPEFAVRGELRGL
jgi:hypothetical protein